jgi:hypothetical protein
MKGNRKRRTTDKSYRLKLERLYTSRLGTPFHSVDPKLGASHTAPVDLIRSQSEFGELDVKRLIDSVPQWKPIGVPCSRCKSEKTERLGCLLWGPFGGKVRCSDCKHEEGVMANIGNNIK